MKKSRPIGSIATPSSATIATLRDAWRASLLRAPSSRAWSFAAAMVAACLGGGSVAQAATVRILNSASTTASGSGSSGIPSLTSFNIPSGKNRVLFIWPAFERDHISDADVTAGYGVNGNTAGTGLGDNYPEPRVGTPPATTSNNQVTARVTGAGGTINRQNALTIGGTPSGDLRFLSISTSPSGAPAGTAFFSVSSFHIVLFENDIATLLGGASSGTVSITLPDVSTPSNAGDDALFVAAVFENVEQTPTGFVRNATATANASAGTPGNTSLTVAAYDAGQAPDEADDGKLVIGASSDDSGFNTPAGHVALQSMSVTNSAGNYDTTNGNVNNEPNGLTGGVYFRNGGGTPSSLYTLQMAGAASTLAYGGVSGSFLLESDNADVGDAPLSYGNASHTISGIRLGASVDADGGLLNNSTSTGDDTDNTDDENGVTMPSGWYQSVTVTVPVSIQNASGYLSAWVDWNGDGDFGDSGERVVNAQSVSSGTVNLSIVIPADVTVGATFARFRVSTNNTGLDNSNTPTGTVQSGEVEDYELTILEDGCPSDPNKVAAGLCGCGVSDSNYLSYYVDGDNDGYGTGSATTSCTAISGSATSSGDCNDDAAGINPGATEVCDASNVDEDCDSLADNADSSAADAGKTNFYTDADNDNYGVGSAQRFCDEPALFAAVAGDCNDANAAIHPTAVENCANIAVDNDCDGVTTAAEAIDSTTYYVDADSDGHSISTTAQFCASTAPTGYLANLSSPVDCDDTRAGVNPAATEVCDAANRDEDCDGVADNDDSSATGKTNWYADADGDGFGAGSATSACDATGNQVATNTDCNDVTADGGLSVYPGAVENCANIAVDNDCDGVTTAAEAIDSTTYYVDADSDGHSISTTAQFCASTAPTGYLANLSSPVDCDDTRAGVNPAATEVCDAANRDEDCDTLADNADSSAADAGKTDFYTDSDNDNYGVGSAQRFCDEPALFAAVAGDCNDGNAAIHPTAVENCANIAVDNDCDGVTTAAEAIDSTTYYVDADSDGHSISTTAQFCASTAPTGYLANLSSPVDCDDTRSSVKPGGTEVCDGLDNDCTGGVDSGLTFSDYYGDSDADGAGDPAVVQNACAQPTGYVSNSNDQCPGSSALINQVTYYRDADGDGFGSALVTQQSCASTAPSGYVTTGTDCDDSALLYADTDSDGFGSGAPAACGVANNTDGCSTDVNKQAPGVCGCGNADTDGNNSGTADCADVTLAMTPLSTHIGPSGTLTVRVSMGASAIYSISGASLSVAFDATKLQFVSATPVAGGPFSSGSVVSSDNVLGRLRYTLALGFGQSATQSAANLVDLAFAPVSGAEACGTTGLVSFGTVGGLGTSLSYSGGGSQSPVVSNLGAIYLDQTAPVITNAFADTALAADAGTIAGAAVTAPSVTAFDACANESRPVSLSIALAGGGTVTSWPVRFPVGVSTITWSSTDQAGNTATDVHTVTVANHQLLDLSVGFVGVIQGTSSRQIRVTAGGQVSLHTVNLTGNSGSVTGVQVPVAASYPCLAVKCPTHSVTDAMAASVSGVRYAATASLPQGDCNDDDMVEIFDYAIFVSQRGAGKATNAIANFNGDTAVGNADFTFIALNFFASGETCTPNADAPTPRDRISVKELRRTGYGHLGVADLNRDGWVDLRDMQMYMQGAGMQGTIGIGQIESRTSGTMNGW